MDIIDLADYLIRTGESSKEVRESLDLLPKFREKWEAYKNASKESGEKIYIDPQGTTHKIPSDTAQKWCGTFELKDLQETYVPKFKPEVQQAIDEVLQGSQIELTAGSLVKLIKENRVKYLERIKDTLEKPHRVIIQNDGALIFARNFGEKKYFTSVARGENGEWTIRSNAPKSENGLNNKIAEGGREIYNSQATSQINAPSPYDGIAKSNTKLDELDSTTKIFNQSDIKIDSLDDFSRFSSLAGESSELKTLRDNLQEILTPILHKDIENLNTGITAQVSKTSIKKMGSDKAVQKSIENGFTKEQHFHASADIENLYKNAAHKTTRADEKNGDKAIKIHEFSALVDEKTQAKILVKESIDKDARKIYTIELEELTPATPMNPRTDGDIASQAPKSKLESGAPLTPLDDVGGNSSAKVFNMQDTKLESLQDFTHYAKLAGVEFASEREAKLAHKHILSNLEKVEC